MFLSSYAIGNILQTDGINYVKCKIENVWYWYVPMFQKQQIIHN